MLNVVSARWESEWTIIYLEILMLEIALGIVRGQEKSWVKIFSIYYYSPTEPDTEQQRTGKEHFRTQEFC